MELFQAQDVTKDTAPPIRPPEQIRQEFSEDIKPVDPPKDLEPTPPRTEPTQETKPPEQVSYSEPPAPPELEQVIEVAGSGMGADKKFKMYPSELAAMYAILKEDGGTMSLEEMQKKLKAYYGIDTEIKNGTLVNTANGHAMISDTNGNGSLDMNDLDFGNALKAAGIDPASIPKPGDMMSMMSNVAYWATYWADELAKNVKEMNRPAEAGPAPAPTGPATPTKGAMVGEARIQNDKLVTVKGGDRQFTMHLSELASMYALLKKQDKPIPVEELQKELKQGFGIDCDLKNIDGQQTLVNKATGHALISDTNGSGMIDPKDLEFEKTLRDNGIDPETIAPKQPAAANG
ncbi:MAG TPA: hypothetical protein V6D05_03445 [Stenomitos sp.]